MRPAAAIIEVAPVKHEKLWRTVKDNLIKSDEHLKVAGKGLLELKADHDAQGGTWAQWETLVKERAGIGKSRASELMRIAGGKTTADEVRADTAERKAKHESEKERSPFQNGENAGDSADAMKAKFAALDTEGALLGASQDVIDVPLDSATEDERDEQPLSRDDNRPALLIIASRMVDEADRFKELSATATVNEELIEALWKVVDVWSDIHTELENRLEWHKADEDGWIEGDDR